MKEKTLTHIKHLLSRKPFKASMLHIGSPIWFVSDKNDKWVCQMMPSLNKHDAIAIAEILNNHTITL